MDLCYDTEFLEDGSTIALISIGMVADDGREYYAVAADAPWGRIKEHRWLCENVVPHLPLGRVGSFPPDRKIIPAPPSSPDLYWFDIDRANALVKPRRVIANEVRDFIQATPDPELWAWCGAYDHVVLCQLWGPMISKPDGVPMFTHDLKQECDRLGNPALPSLPGVTEHNALSDAREVQFRRRWLSEHAALVETPATMCNTEPASGSLP
jgi:3' exoribonuclease, RNase T-like